MKNAIIQNNSHTLIPSPHLYSSNSFPVPNPHIIMTMDRTVNSIPNNTFIPSPLSYIPLKTRTFRNSLLDCRISISGSPLRHLLRAGSRDHHSLRRNWCGCICQSLPSVTPLSLCSVVNSSLLINPRYHKRMLHPVTVLSLSLATQ